MADLAAAQAAIDDAVTEGTTKKQALAWSRWLQYLESIDLDHDPFLDDLGVDETNRVLSAFAAAVRAARFSGERYSRLVCSTVEDTVDKVSQTFRANDRSDPRHDRGGNTAFLLQRQFRGYKNQDPGEKQQKAITGSILRKMYRDATTDVDRAVSELAIGAFFFAMRSCEYSSVSGDRRTKLLCIRNIAFRFNDRTLRHDDPNLHRADTVSITFEYQKRDERDETITQHPSGDPLLCPVRMWAAIVQRILSYEGTSEDTQVNTILFNGKLMAIKGSAVLSRIRRAVTVIGKAVLGYSPEDVGTHSIRSGAAMAMFLADVPLFVIMLQGRWSSDAFLRYIRKQVKQFSRGISAKMIRNEHFFTIPSVSRFDPRTPGHPNNFTTRDNIGRNAQRQAMQPAFALNI